MLKCYCSTLVLLCLSVGFLQGQSSSDEALKGSKHWSIHVKYGMPFFEKTTPTFSSFTSEVALKPAYHTTIGLGYQIYVLENLSLAAGASYEWGSFKRVENYEYTSFNEIFRQGAFEDRYTTHSFLLPIRAHVHLNRLSFSLGILSTFHFATSVDIEQRYWVDGVLVETYEGIRFKDGDRLTFGTGAFIDRTNVDLERKINFQLALGFQFRLTEKLTLAIEARQNLRKNRLVKEVFNYDVGGSLIEYYNPYPRLLTIGLSYNLPSKS